MSLRVSTTSRVITAYVSAPLLRATARALDLQGEVERCVSLKERQRGLTEGQFVVAMAEPIALGARCLDDLAVTRSDEAQQRLRGFEVPAPQTAGTWLRRFTLGHLCQLDKALATMHRRAFSLTGPDDRPKSRLTRCSQGPQVDKLALRVSAGVDRSEQ